MSVTTLTIITAIGSVLAGLSALITAIYSFSNNRPYLEVEVEHKTVNFGQNTIRFDEDRSYSIVKIRNTGSRAAYNIKINEGGRYKLITLLPGEDESIRTKFFAKNYKIRYTHFSNFFYPFYFTANTANRTKNKDFTKFRSGDISRIEGRKKLRVFLKEVIKYKKINGYIGIGFSYKEDYTNIMVQFTDLNENYITFSSVFRSDLYEVLVFLKNFTKPAFRISEKDYFYMIPNTEFEKIYKKNFKTILFDLFGEIESERGHSNRFISSNFKESLVNEIHIDEKMKFERSRSHNSRYILLKTEDGQLNFNRIYLDNKYIRETDQYIILCESRKSFVISSNVSTKSYNATVINKINKTIVSSEVADFRNKYIKLNDKQFESFLSLFYTLRDIDVKRDRKATKISLIDILSWISYSFNKNFIIKH